MLRGAGKCNGPLGRSDHPERGAAGFAGDAGLEVLGELTADVVARDEVAEMSLCRVEPGVSCTGFAIMIGEYGATERRSIDAEPIRRTIN